MPSVAYYPDNERVGWVLQRLAAPHNGFIHRPHLALPVASRPSRTPLYEPPSARRCEAVSCGEWNQAQRRKERLYFYSSPAGRMATLFKSEATIRAAFRE